MLLALRPRTPGFRRRLATALTATFVGGVAWRLVLAFAAPSLHLPLGHLAQPAELANYVTLLNAAYFPSGPRVAELALGALLGLLLRSQSALTWLLHR